MNLTKLSKWILIIGGLSVGYQGLTGVDLIGTTLGGLKMIVDLLVGLAAINLAYVLLTNTKKK